MNFVVEQMLSVVSDDTLMHYGMPRRSGRYPWGSGDNPYQRSISFLGRIEELKKTGWKATPENIKAEFGEEMSTSRYRQEVRIARYEERLYKEARVKSLKDDGLNNSEIARKMGINESSVRNLLNKHDVTERMAKVKGTADMLKKEVNKYGMVDVGAGMHQQLNISKEHLDTALLMLEKEGYHIYGNRMEQPTNPGQHTVQKVLCTPETKHNEIYELDRIHTIGDVITKDHGEHYDTFVYPKSMDSKRLKILLADEVGPDGETGSMKDGLVQIRRGVEDLSLGNDRYAQVRILVDDNKYIKGMAVYSDNMPDGVDVIFNTNKTSYDKALKPIKTDDPKNPFGSSIKAGGQSYYYDKDGNRQLSLINKRASEGDWSEWKDALPSQFLAKQSKYMAKKQLDLAKADKLAEFESIKEINNPVIRQHYLDKFASECDSAAVHLQAAALPNQKYHVIVPVNSIKETEVYAPRYENGTKLALVRYPHGGIFEIPILTVNNKNKTAREILGEQAGDGIAINKKNADRLSGADFDGDTVMCIPTHDKAGKVHITNRDNLPGLVGFDPHLAYPERPGMVYMTKANTQKQMGIISNLITDMTIAGATDEHLAAAVRHSMVVIDAEKHKLDYKRSEQENNIAALKKMYQIKVNPDGTEKTGGASTILSRAKGQLDIPKRQGQPKVNIKGKPYYDPSKPEGSLLYKTADDLYYAESRTDKKTGIRTLTTTDGKKIQFNTKDRDAYERYAPIKRVNEATGEVYFTNRAGDIHYNTKIRTQKSTQMGETEDAYTLVSPRRHSMELIYADYANSMKALARKARIESATMETQKKDPQAAKIYAEEVSSLKAKLNEAEKNKVRERAAIRRTNAIMNQRLKENPDMSNEDIKKAKSRLLQESREEVGSVKRRERHIPITDKEWEAIQARAVAADTLKRILNNTDPAELRQRATPRATNTVSTAQANRIRAMANSNYTIAEIADKLNLSTSTIHKYLKG